MTLNIPIPEHLDEETIRRLDREAREAVAVSLYRQGKLSHGQFATYLGIARGLVDEVLGRHGVLDEYSADEIAEQAKTLTSLRRSEPTDR